MHSLCSPCSSWAGYPNHQCRRPVSISALLLAAAGCLTQRWVHSFLAILVGRQGHAAGLAPSALGVFLSGVLVEFARAPRVLIFCVFAALLLDYAIALATRPETFPPATPAPGPP